MSDKHLDHLWNHVGPEHPQTQIALGKTPKAESSTPISNGAAFNIPSYDQPVVPLYISQNLERQLAEVTKQRDALAGLLEKSIRYIHDPHKANCIATLKGDKP